LSVSTANGLGSLCPLLVLAAATCTPVEPIPATEAVRDVLLVTLDTARWDHFSFAGSGEVQTPNIDRVATRGVAFAQAIAPSPITLPSHASLLTGQRPPTHGVRDNGTFSLPDSAVTLAELFHEAGFQTGAFVGAMVLDKRYGLAQGFDLYDDRLGGDRGTGLFEYPSRRGEAVVSAAEAWLEGRDAPTFTWVHLYDPHAPHDPPEPERTRFAGAPYRGEIAYTDRLVGRLLEAYERMGRTAGLLAVVTADHGESLGAHGEKTHGVFVYDATLRIPLVIAGPGVPRGRRVDPQVRLIDVFPTVLALSGLEIPEGVEGLDLRALMSGETVQTPPAYIESLLPRLHHGWVELRGLRSERWKLILGAEPELYDLQADPGEQLDVAAGQPERVERLRGRLAELEAADPVTESRLELDSAAAEKLGALGYISTPTPEVSLKRADPRKMIGLLQKLDHTDGMFAFGMHDEALEVYREVLRADPTNNIVQGRLGNLLMKVGRFAEAEAAYERMVELAPEDPRAWEKLGHALQASGKLEEALAALERAVDLGTAWHDARWTRWDLMRRAGLLEEARTDVRAALEKDPTDGLATAAQLTLEPAGDPAEARRRVERALSSAHPTSRLLLVAAETFARISLGSRAIELYEQAMTLRPLADHAVVDLARLYLAEERLTDAQRLLDRPATSSVDVRVLVVQAEVAAQAEDLEALTGAIDALGERLGSPDPKGAQDGRSAGTLAGIGDRLWREGRYELAARAYGAAAGFVGGDFRPAYNEGLAWERAGHEARAIAAFRRALSLEPGHARSKAHLTALEQRAPP
jgi:arylsulfatase A-like enzyme/Flp pilus assembly protein TadD